jgi:hypothetical protein
MASFSSADMPAALAGFLAAVFVVVLVGMGNLSVKNLQIGPYYACNHRLC